MSLKPICYISVAESFRISSTTFAQCAAKATELGEITQNNGHYADRGHRFWYQSKANIRLPVSD